MKKSTSNLVPRVFSLFNMAAARPQKHVTKISNEAEDQNCVRRDKAMRVRRSGYEIMTEVKRNKMAEKGEGWLKHAWRKERKKDKLSMYELQEQSKVLHDDDDVLFLPSFSFNDSSKRYCTRRARPKIIRVN